MCRNTWGLVLSGVGIAVMIELLGLPVLPVAIGLYLPIHLSAPIFVGGMIRWFFDRKIASKDEEKKKKAKRAADNGVLYCSGLIAGEGLVGILLAVFAVVKVSGGQTIASKLNLAKEGEEALLGNGCGIIFFILLSATIVFFAVKKSKVKDKSKED